MNETPNAAEVLATIIKQDEGSGGGCGLDADMLSYYDRYKLAWEAEKKVNAALTVMAGGERARADKALQLARVLGIWSAVSTAASVWLYTH